jgi:hypothetical protein
MISAEYALGIESHAPTVALPAFHAAFTVFVRIASLRSLEFLVPGSGRSNEELETRNIVLIVPQPSRSR